MIRRWRALLRPEMAGQPASPSPAEAFGGWMIGTLWALFCLWLGDVGTHSLVPGVLLGGLFALWGWRHIEWLFWLPPVVVLAVLVEPLMPSPLRGPLGPVEYVDILMLGVLAVALARSLAFRRRVTPRTPLDLAWVALLALCGLEAAITRGAPGPLATLEHALVAALVYYAAAAVAGRPGGSRWVWPAFPVAAALVGLHGLGAWLLGPEVLVTHVRLADARWGATHGLFGAALAAAGVSAGLALDGGSRAGRRVWSVAAAAGVLGLCVHLATQRVVGAPRPWTGPQDVVRALTVSLAGGMLVALAVMSWRFGRARPAERPRWTALALTFLLMPLAQAGAEALSGPAAQLLLATGGGLVMGARRAAARDAARLLEAQADEARPARPGLGEAA